MRITITLKVANEWAFETCSNLSKLQYVLGKLFRGSYCDRMWTFTMYYILKTEGLKGFKLKGCGCLKGVLKSFGSFGNHTKFSSF